MVIIEIYCPRPTLIRVPLQFRLAYKEENAHDVSIWSCDWAKLKPGAGNGGDNPEGSQEPFGMEQDIIVTGGLDDVVKVWNFDDNELHLKHTLTGHSLGIVSVAISSDGQSEYYVYLAMTPNPFSTTFQPSPAALWTLRCDFGKQSRANC